MAQHTLSLPGVGRFSTHEWLEVGKRVYQQIDRDRLSIVAAGVAFYALLAIFPAMVALMTLYGLFFDPEQVTRQVAALEGVLPQQAVEVVTSQLQGLVESNRGALGWGFAGSLLLTLWSASKGIKTLLQALNIAYDERETRSFVKRTLLTLGMTLAAIVGAAIAIATVVFLPVVIGYLGLGETLENVISYARWPIVAVAIGLGIAVVYRYGPSRDHPSWALVAWGAVIATTLWLVGSALFSFYVSNFGNFNKTYGSIAALVILLVWFLLSAYAVLIGAEFNAEMERQKARKEGTKAEPRERKDGEW